MQLWTYHLEDGSEIGPVPEQWAAGFAPNASGVCMVQVGERERWWLSWARIHHVSVVEITDQEWEDMVNGDDAGAADGPGDPGPGDPGPGADAPDPADAPARL